MRITLLLFVLWLIPSAAYTQKTMSIEDAVTGRYGKLRPKEPQSLTWKDNNSYVWVDNDALWENSIKKDDAQQAFSTADISSACARYSVRFSQQFPMFTISGKGMMIIRQASDFFFIDMEQRTCTHYLKASSLLHIDVCDNCEALAFVDAQNLYVSDKDGKRQITNDSLPGLVNGRDVHRREFGITKGTFWSPTGRYLAFYRMDESMVNDYPLVSYTPAATAGAVFSNNVMTSPARSTHIKYPMSGTTSHEVTVGIYDMETDKTVFLDTGLPKDRYFTNISWGPDEKLIYIAELNRDQNHMQMNSYDVATGRKINTLFEETATTYVEPLHPIVFSKADPDLFYHRSRRDGWRHLYLYRSDGTLVRQITKGDWEVTDFYGEDEKGKNIFIQSTAESPLQRHIYKVDVSTGRMTKLSKKNGTNAAFFSPDKKHMILKREDSGTPVEITLNTSDGNQLRQISKAADPLAAEGYELGANEIVTIKSADNTIDLYGRLILPNDFDPQKKYPAIIYVYGGPHSQLITDRWLNGTDWWHYYMAANGYIVFTLDNRGTNNRGQAFEEVIHRNLGVNETADQMEGLKYLKSLGYVDPDRIGVYGWSYGGFMTLNMKLRHPGTFKVAVAGGPVTEWHMYEIMYGERYMDHPADNTQGYNATNMTRLTGNLEGKLLIIHGGLDETVVMQHSMSFITECIRQGKQLDFFVYPVHQHNVGGTPRIHLLQKISQYFFDYL